MSDQILRLLEQELHRQRTSKIASYYPDERPIAPRAVPEAHAVLPGRRRPS